MVSGSGIRPLCFLLMIRVACLGAGLSPRVRGNLELCLTHGYLFVVPMASATGPVLRVVSDVQAGGDWQLPQLLALRAT